MINLREFVKREWFLTFLILLFLILSVIDPSLPRKSLNLVDYESLSAIISFLIISRGLELSGALTNISSKIVSFSGNSEFKLLCTLVFITATSSAVIMNDSAVFVFVPLVLTISKISDIDVSKAVTVVALSSNIGSSLTPFGNPQNIIIWRTYKVSVFDFVRSMFPYVFVWILILILLIRLMSGKREFETFQIPGIEINKVLLITSATLLMANVGLIECGYAFLGLIATLLTFSILGREAIYTLDLALIAVFALIFIDFKELSFLLSAILKPDTFNTFLLSAILSQIISNVPTTVMLIPHSPKWLPLSVGVNLGGTGSVIGSLANFIAVRLSKIEIGKFHRVSIPYFLLTLFVTLISLKLFPANP